MSALFLVSARDHEEPEHDNGQIVKAQSAHAAAAAWEAAYAADEIPGFLAGDGTSYRIQVIRIPDPDAAAEGIQRYPSLPTEIFEAEDVRRVRAAQMALEI